MMIPSTDSGDSITDRIGFLDFVESALRRTPRRLHSPACALLHRGASTPIALVANDDRPALRAVLADLGRLSDVDCGVGVGVTFGYPGTATHVLADGVDLDRAFGPFEGTSPRTTVSYFACLLDDRTVLESFRFLEMVDGKTRGVAARDEMALTFAFAEIADVAIGSLRDILGDRRPGRLPDAFAALVERLAPRGRAYLERAVDACEIGPARPGAVCEASTAAGIPCSSGPLVALSGDVVDPLGSVDRARCANHAIPMLETASAGLVRLGLESRAWFAERAAGVLATVRCATCDVEGIVPVVVTDRRILSRARSAELGLGDLFARYLEFGPRPTPSPAGALACCDAAARPADLTDRVARNAFDERLRLAWTCDLRAYVTRGALAAGLRINLAGSDASDLIDLSPLRAPRFDSPAFSLAPPIERRRRAR